MGASERLTKRHPNGVVGISECRYYNYDDFQKMARKLADYEDIDTVEKLRELKERATKKRPKMRHVKPYDSYNDGWCPCCGAYVQEYEYDTFFCQRCGQALNWSEEEDCQ